MAAARKYLDELRERATRLALKNPKYTGYQVYNRRARRSRGGRNKPNPPQMWVWSVEPAHEPLIPKWMFDEINRRSAARRGSRGGAGLKMILAHNGRIGTGGGSNVTAVDG